MKLRKELTLMKRFNRRRLIISGILLILVIVLIVFIKLDAFTYSKYEKQVTSNNNLNTAIYLLDDSYQTVSVRIPDIIPSNNQYLYTFSVSNFKDDKHCDTNLEYVVHIRTTTNLRIDYELYNTLDIDDAESIITSNNVEQDRDGTYFRHILTDSKTMLYSEDETEYYTLLLNLPSDYKDAKYSGVPEVIEINIESKQILDSDN